MSEETRLELAPPPGWRFRLTLCNENGIRENDDFNDPGMLPECASRLYVDLKKKIKEETG